MAGVQRIVDTAPVVPEGVEVNLIDIVLELLRVGVGLARVAFHVHVHGQVLALHETVRR